ncbi:MAG: hypothetical protein RLN99_03015 [Kiloniellaceae bacterium]
MYLWRNLPEGQLTAVLRWLGHRREDRRLTSQNAAKPAEAQTLAADELPPAR